MTPNESDSTNLGRRNVLKALGTTATVGGLGFLSTSAAAGSGRAISPEDHEAPYPDVQVRRVDRSVKSVSAHYPLLTLPEDSVISFIEDSSYTQKEKQEAIQALADLRRKYPVKKERDGNTTWFTLARDVDKTKEDARKFEAAQRAFGDGASDRRGFSIMQYGSLHRKMTEDACNEMSIDPTGIADHADDPDKPDVQIGVPDGIPHDQTVEDGLENALNEILHHYGQYYDTDAYEIWHNDHHEDSFGGLGGATHAANWHMQNARDYCCSTEDEYLGQATHYPQDMGVPLHTGMGWEQANLEIYYNSSTASMDWRLNPMYWLHDEYEHYVNDNWTGGHYLKYEYGSHECSSDYCYYPVNDVEEEIYQLADYTGQYSYDCYHHIVNEGDVDWESWDSNTKDWMKKITTNCIDETGLYVRGFIQDIKK